MTRTKSLRELVREAELCLETVSQGVQGRNPVRLPPEDWARVERLVQAVAEPLREARKAIDEGKEEPELLARLSKALAMLTDSVTLASLRPAAAVRTRGAAIRTRGAVRVCGATALGKDNLAEAPASLTRLLNETLYAG